MPDFLLHLDQTLFQQINSGWSNSFFDWLMPLLRYKYIWIPLYLFLLIFLPYKYKRNGWLMVLGLLVTVILSDQISSSLIKPLVERLRPCNDPAFREQVNLLINCGSGYSFVSSHAANHFGLAMFFGLALRDRFRWVFLVGLIWAAAIALAQVYVGVHYPIDVTAGACLGIGIGALVYWFIQRYFAPAS